MTVDEKVTGFMSPAQPASSVTRQSCTLAERTRGRLAAEPVPHSGGMHTPTGRKILDHETRTTELLIERNEFLR